MDIKHYISDLDTKRFGFNIAKVDHFDYQPEVILKFLKSNNVKLVLSKISVDDLELINNLENLGFIVKDIQITYKYDLHNLGSKEIIKNKDLIIRDFEVKDIPALQQIASDSFLNYGHYANDKKLDIKKCNDIYSDWITRSCEDKNVADKVIVAVYKGEIAGFLSFKIHQMDHSKYAAGGLGAVSDKFREMNIFRIIVSEGLHWGKEIGLDWEQHNALVNNFPVIKSFLKSGFYPNKSFITLHHWIE